MAKAKAGGYHGMPLHWTAARLTVNGSGNLQLFVKSKDEINSYQFNQGITMFTSTNKMPTPLVNAIEQKAYLQVQTAGFGEWFNIASIYVFVTPVALSLPTD